MKHSSMLGIDRRAGWEPGNIFFDSEGKALGEVTSPFQNNRKAPYGGSVLSVAPDGHFAITAFNRNGILTEIYLPDGRLRDKHEIGVGEVAKSKIAALGLTRVGVSAGGGFALLWWEGEIKSSPCRRRSSSFGPKAEKSSHSH